MSLVAIIGWGLFGLTALVAWLRGGGIKADLARSEADRKRLEEELRAATSDHADSDSRLRQVTKNLRTDLSIARDELNQLYEDERVPGVAPLRLDSAIKRANKILTGLGES